MRRRARGFTALAAALAAVAGTWAGVAYSEENPGDRSGVRKGEGVGVYLDPSTANQASTFTISRRLVTCGVGAENLPGIGRFEMLMFSTRIREYSVSAAKKEITVRGEMRSITRAGGATAEDVRHPFIAHASDLDGDETQPRADRFDVHMRSGFWNHGNAMCTKSDRYPGLCRFGGRLIAGNIRITAAEEDDDHDD